MVWAKEKSALHHSPTKLTLYKRFWAHLFSQGNKGRESSYQGDPLLLHVAQRPIYSGTQPQQPLPLHFLLKGRDAAMWS